MMSSTLSVLPAASAAQRPALPCRSKELYFALSDAPSAHGAAAQDYLRDQIAAAQKMPADLPGTLHELPAWIEERTQAVGEQYRAYLAARKNGTPRRYFRSRSHALYFLRAVAPTKLVDGAWLYGVLRHWDNADFHPLIRTYLEELGDGVPDKNHVTLYRRLLATHGCEHWQRLDDQHFVQGAIQLALAHNAQHFLPELVGYNLGYEQLPLHLLTTAYELNELGIDPYYFTLHVTVDNAATGHAHKALEALNLLMPRAGRDEFWRRVRDGYRLNELGASTNSVIAEFDLEKELVRILAAKSATGRNLHSDYCRVAGRTVNDWLADPAQIPSFLAALESAGWIKRGEPAENSRFWRLVDGERAEMFGVFTTYERQVLRDWITGGAGEPKVLTYRARRRTLDQLGLHAGQAASTERGLIRRHRAAGDIGEDNELRQLEERIAGCEGKPEAMAMLAGFMSPTAHHTSVGLMATRMYSQLLDA